MSTFGLLATVFVTSLLGSLHCIGMCGGIVSACVLGGCKASSHQRGRWEALAAYHFGRLVAYSCLGAIAGAVGHSVDRSGEMLGFQNSASLLAGVFIVLLGVEQLGLVRLPGTGLVSRFFSFVSRFGAKFSDLGRGAYFGCLSGLLPCGWLYAYVVLAASTGSLLIGVSVMMVFWLGTVPALTAFGGLMTGLRERWLGRNPKLGALLLIGLGFFTLGTKFFPLHLLESGQQSESMHCHH